MAEKQAPLGICDLCGERFPPGVSIFTLTRGTPRLYCSDTCKATANSRAGAPIRSRKARERVRRGEWQNPGEFLTDDKRRAIARRGGAARAKQHRVALEAGTWRNPADSPGARRKLSRPRRHGDNPTLHSAIEKLSCGLRVADLTPEEAEAHREYRRNLRAANPERARQYARESYRRRMATPEGKAKQREKWKRERQKLQKRPPNKRLKEAKAQAGLSQATLAEMVGVSQTTVSQWERFSVTPRSDEVRQRVVEALGADVWEIEG